MAAVNKPIDYQFIALMICSVLGWSLQQVFSLTWAQFTYISCQLYRLQYQRAKNEIHFGVCAALGGETNRQNLIDSAGGFFLDEPEQKLTYTEEDFKVAMEKVNKITASAKAEEEKNNV